jgi:hypothetical protein
MFTVRCLARNSAYGFVPVSTWRGIADLANLTSLTGQNNIEGKQCHVTLVRSLYSLAPLQLYGALTAITSYRPNRIVTSVFVLSYVTTSSSRLTVTKPEMQYHCCFLWITRQP